MCLNILKWDYRKDFKQHHFDLIVASPPCTEYSQAKTTAPRNLIEADRLVVKALEIIYYFKPKAWWLENPKTGLLKTRDFMSEIPFVDVDYCQFSDWGYQKPTRIWCSTNIARLQSLTCDNISCQCMEDTPLGRRHRERLGGNSIKFSTVKKYRVPENLIDYLLTGCPEIDQEYLWKTMAPKRSFSQKDLYTLHDVRTKDIPIPADCKQLLLQVKAMPPAGRAES
jgi:hypothetical protein